MKKQQETANLMQKTAKSKGNSRRKDNSKPADSSPKGEERDDKKHKRSPSWILCSYEEIQRWSGDNEYIRNFHRPNFGCVKKCMKSIFRLHNETLNIWTHILGCFAIIVVATWIFIKDPLNFQISQTGISRYPDRLDGMQTFIFMLYFITALMCMTFSWVFHAFKCHSYKAHNLLVKFDYLGILTLMFGSNFPLTYYGFYCHKYIFYALLVVVTIICIVCSCIVCIDKFSTSAYRITRAFFFLGLGFFTVVPLLISTWMNGWDYTYQALGVEKLFVTSFFYITGVGIYALRIPERLKPGYFDLYFHSHQIFHVFVVIGAIILIFGICDCIIFRTTPLGLCPT